MTDDIWRNEDDDDRSSGRRPGRLESQMDEFDEDEFGGPLFGDDSGGVDTGGRSDENPALSLSDDSTGPLPHWTAEPTGEVPKIDAVRPEAGQGDDFDVWSTFTSESPVWKEGDSVDEPSGAADAPSDPTGELRWEDDPSGGTDVEPIEPDAGLTATTMTGVVDVDAPREPARITIGTDPSGMPRRPDPVRRGSTPQRPPSDEDVEVGTDGRNLPIAIAVGAALGAVFLALTIFVGPQGSLAFVAAVLGIAGFEYFGKVTEKGYRPAVAPGLMAVIFGPLAGYYAGPQGVLLVVAFAFLAGAFGFVGAASIESGPMPNMAITTLGVVWIGVLGSYAGLILAYSNGGGPDGRPWGTDTLVILAIGVAANDIGAYFVGSAWGRTPLRKWISPAKSAEGAIGGTLLTLVAMVIIDIRDVSETWSSLSHLLIFGIVISILAPLGDLTESMFKRNLDVKDFGTVIKGHGGVLDRFDGVLFTLPGAYYLLVVLTPWTEFVPG